MPKQYRPLDFVVLGYKKIKGFEFDDKGWDKRHYPRAAKTAKLILELFDGNWEKAVDYMCNFSIDYQMKRLDFTIETMYRNYDDWRIKHAQAAKRAVGQAR